MSFKVGLCPSFLIPVGFPHIHVTSSGTQRQKSTQTQFKKKKKTQKTMVCFFLFLCTIYNLIINIVIFPLSTELLSQFCNFLSNVQY